VGLHPGTAIPHRHLCLFDHHNAPTAEQVSVVFVLLLLEINAVINGIYFLPSYRFRNIADL